MEVMKSVESRVARVSWLWKPVRRDESFWHPINSRKGRSSGVLRGPQRLVLSPHTNTDLEQPQLGGLLSLVLSYAPLVYGDVAACESESGLHGCS